jgi:phosphoribosylanthranilate isomerase
MLAVEAGADAVGFLVGIRHLTEDSLVPTIAKHLVSQTPPFVNTVMVTHLVHANEILDLHDTLLTSTIQLHDELDPQEIETIRTARPHLTLIKAIHVVDDTAIEAAEIFAPYVDALLLDSRTAERIGGTGLSHDWNISQRIVASASKPVILAGGLNPSNVAEAIRKVKPYGVDVNSGVDDAEGKKDGAKLHDFIKGAKSFSPENIP